MIAGFDLNSPLVCEGIIGDGCGGGRIFFAQERGVFVYDPVTQEKVFLVEVASNISEISKSACVITLKTESKIYKYDLSALKIIET